MKESNSTTFFVKIADIDVGSRLTPISQPYVERLAASIDEIGLLQPIVIRPQPNSGYYLVAGAHRLAAYEVLGNSMIEARIIEPSDALAAIAEIDENLIRRTLTAYDEGVSLRERKALHEVAFPDARHGGDRRKKKQEGQNVPLETKRFTASVANKVGWDERTIKRRLQLANSLDKEAVSLARNTGLIENASQMLKLAAFPADKQITLMRHMKDRGTQTIGDAEYALGWKTRAEKRSPSERLISMFGDLLVSAPLAQLVAMKTQLDRAILQRKGDII